MARRLALAANYPENVREAVREMHRQVGDLVFHEDGLALRGLLVRHLVKPEGLVGSREIYRSLSPSVLSAKRVPYPLSIPDMGCTHPDSDWSRTS